MCEAHRNGVRIVRGAPNDIPFKSNETEIREWVESLVQDIVSRNLDGVTFDYESPLSVDDPNVQFYSDIVNRTTQRLHEVSPGSQTSVCVAWSPDDIDGRAYDVVGLADASDLLYVMSYDTRSQIFDRCIASANSPTSRARYGLQRYLDLGISPKKLILGTPWYVKGIEISSILDTHTHTGTATIILVKRAWRPSRKVRTARSISSRFEASTVQMQLDESAPLQTFKTYEPMILPRPMYVSMNLQRRRFFIMLIRKHPKFIKCGMTTRSRHH